MTFEKLIQKLVIPYLVYEMLYYLLYVFVIHKDTGLYLNRPKFSLWYLMALFFWRIATPYIKKIPGSIFVSITAGLLIGFSQLGNFFSIPRTLFFYPFFLAGYYFQESWFETVRKKWKFLASSLACVLLLFFGGVFAGSIQLTPWIFYGRYSYEEHGYDPRYRNACTSWMLWNFFSTCFYIVCRYPKKETFLLCFRFTHHAYLSVSWLNL